MMVGTETRKAGRCWRSPGPDDPWEVDMPKAIPANPGDQHGEWTIVTEAPKRGRTRYVLATCRVCGTNSEVNFSSIRYGTSKSCCGKGHGWGGRLSAPIEVGQIFGMWTVLSVDRGDDGYRRASVQCGRCGNIKLRYISSLLNGDSKSCCGTGVAATTHGMSGTGIHSSWEGMKQRGSGSHRNYEGVSYDPRWETFEGFLAHQPTSGPAWFQGAHLARHGDEGDYTPENTRWATPAENYREALDKRAHRMPDGRIAYKVAESNGISTSTFASRVNCGWGIERAATEAVHTPSRTPDGRLGRLVAQENGISDATYYRRIRSGWCVDRAANEPTRDKRN